MDDIVVLMATFISGGLVATWFVCRVMQGPLQAELTILRDLDKKGIRIRTMMIKTETDCACAHAERLPELKQETVCINGICK